MPDLHRGHVFHVGRAACPAEAVAALVELPDGALLVSDEGMIEWCGPWTDVPPEGREATVHDHHGSFLLPGFVDTHVHFPQMHALDAFGGGQLLEWLDHVVFPAEARFQDVDFARRSARQFCERLVRVGTTTSLVFGSQFPVAQDALFEETRRAGLRMILGRTTMTVGPPSAAPLLTSETEAIESVRDEVERWHPLDPVMRSTALQQVAVIPRFALSVTPRTLRSLGELYEFFRADGVYFTSHLSENNRPHDGEVDSVVSTYGVERYLDVFDGRFLVGSASGGPSLLGRRSVLAHAVHCTDDEFSRLAASGSALAHCPVSQQFLGSGTLPWRRAVRSGVTIAIGTDIAAGDEWFIPRVLNACFKVHHGETGEAGHALHPAELLFLATLSGARALDLDQRIGNFEIGKDADFVVIDPGLCDELGSRLESRQPLADQVSERDALLFALLMAATESAVAATYVRGRLLRPASVDTAPTA